MNKFTARKNLKVSNEARKLLSLASQLDALADKRADGKLMILQGQAEGLREAANLVRGRIRTLT